MAVKFKDGTYGPGIEWLDFYRWDRFRLANGRLDNTLFNLSPNATRDGVVLTRADTNNPGQQIPLKQKWVIWKILFYYQAIAIRNDAAIQFILDMLRTTIFSLNVESKDRLFEAMLGMFWEGSRQIQHVPTAAGNNVPYGSETLFKGEIKLEVPIVLEELTNWQVDFEHIVAPNAALDGDFIGLAFNTELFRMH